MVPHIACSELLLHLGDDDVLVVDCRSGPDWERLAVHVPGALRVPPEELADVAASLPDDERIVLCGLGGSGRDARRALHVLEAHGLHAVCLLGGLEEWVTLGFPTERHAPRRASLSDASASP